MLRLLVLMILLGCTTENNLTFATNERPKARTINVKVDDDIGKAMLEYGSLVDERDGREYKTMGVSGQWWMAENLAYLPKVTALMTFYDEEQVQYFVYGYNGTDLAAAKNHENYSLYGALYNHDAAMEACPSGWHLPSKEEWEGLINALDATDDVGTRLKSAEYWDGTDDYGFNALPGGDGPPLLADSKPDRAGWWTNTTSLEDMCYAFTLESESATASFVSSLLAKGYSVRCVQN
ncbi:MAG: hypothetical protein GX801_10915 [Fibrobacter sp.]|nr:hypothetical protein [Fibrobacter sp.]